VRARELRRRAGATIAKAREWVILGIGILMAPVVLWVMFWMIAFLVAGYHLFKVLPCLIWYHFRSVWRILGNLPPHPRGPAPTAEPARAAHVHRIGPHTLRVLWQETRQSYATQLEGTLKRDYELLGTKKRPRKPVELRVDRVLGLGACAYRGCLALVVTLAAGTLTVPAVVFLVLAWATLLAVFRAWCGVCWVTDRIVRELTGTATVCPHPHCGRAVELPVRACPGPGCTARHRRLVPGRYGAVHRTCRCGARMPAATLFGARRLRALCPHCSGALPPGDSAARLVLVVGAPGSGRSTVVRSGLAQLAEAVRRCGGDVTGGVPGTGTARLHGLRGGRRSLVLLDPHGPAFTAQSGIDALDGLRRAHGLLLAVDVLALPSVRRALTAGDRERIGSTTAAAEDPVQAAERVLRTITALPARRRPRRISVVLTKTAVLRHTSVGSELGADGADGTDGLDVDAAVRRWLEVAGAGNLARSLDSCGIPVRYLADGPAAAQDAALGGLLLWTAGVAVARRRLPRLPRLRLPLAALDRLPRLPRLPGVDRTRYALRASHLVGFVSLPLTLSLLFAAALPATALFGLPAAFDRWDHPLTGFDRETDVAAYRRGVAWPTFRASYATAGSSATGPRDGVVGYWATAGSPNTGKPGASDWLEVDFGAPIPISAVDLDLDLNSTTAFTIQTPRSGGGWETPVSEHDVATFIFPDDFEMSQNEVSLGVTASAIRIAVPAPSGSDFFELDGLYVWSPSNALLRLRAVGPDLMLTDTVNRAVAVQVLPPSLPPGWRAVSTAPLPRRVSAGATAVAAWRFTAGADAPPGPVDYQVRITDGGHTATASCVALLRMTPSGPLAQPVTCAAD
jgi:hypothetical protein